jgi:hypothetical protein
MGMKHRKLRIAWSVGWGLICLLLMAWCAFGYVPGLSFQCGVTKSLGLQFTSIQGQFDVRRSTLDGAGHFKGLAGVNSTTVSAPWWLPVAFALALAAVPWLRFSLRTLLIGMTVIAVLLGLIAAMMLTGS